MTFYSFFCCVSPVFSDYGGDSQTEDVFFFGLSDGGGLFGGAASFFLSDFSGAQSSPAVLME